MQKWTLAYWVSARQMAFFDFRLSLLPDHCTTGTHRGRLATTATELSNKTCTLIIVTRSIMTMKNAICKVMTNQCHLVNPQILGTNVNPLDCCYWFYWLLLHALRLIWLSVSYALSYHYHMHCINQLEKVALDSSVECCAPPPRWRDLELWPFDPKK